MTAMLAAGAYPTQRPPRPRAAAWHSVPSSPRPSHRRVSNWRRGSFGYADVELPELGRTFSFPHRGSGLLFARSTGVKVWEGAFAMAKYIAGSRAAVQQGTREVPFQWQDKLVVELGCGLGFVSMAAAHLGAQVVATDGDLDVVNVAKRNIKHNTQGCAHAVRAGQLPWGSDLRLAQLRLPRLPVDAVLLSDVVYGSDPSVWRQLVATLRALAGPSTLVLQSETFRLEGRYGAYWEYLQQEGFGLQELQLDEQCNPSGKCRLWRLGAPPRQEGEV